ncbi:MAG TPA: nickel pincer cofactor biosynthesis protein LarB [Ktedonobacterales bacterium]|nr:nickel pincer cofactor biosynthesis protein LarB [Ktedonobacterales bacterium]
MATQAEGEGMNRVFHHITEEMDLLSQLADGEVGQCPQAGSAEPSRSHALQPTSIDETHLDFGREQRKGIPEVILAENKTDTQVLSIAHAFIQTTGRALISRMRPELFGRVHEVFAECDLTLREPARAAAIYRRGYAPPQTGGRVGLISAGTADIPVAEEARLIAEAMGCVVSPLYDVGVAGLHRLLQPLRLMLEQSVDAIIVAAGMDGALPSVVSGLVDVPVIGLPTSVGYGLGGKGVAALLSMLQTCAPGLTVVNIDNGVGAGSTAALIANRVARARQASSKAMSSRAEEG